MPDPLQLKVLGQLVCTRQSPGFTQPQALAALAAALALELA